MKLCYSISLRLTFWFSAVFLLGFLIFGLALYADLDFTLRAGRVKTLSNRARRLNELLQSTRTDSSARQASKFADFSEATPEGQLIQVFDTSGNRAYPPPSLAAVNFPWPLTIKPVRQFSEASFSGRQYLVLSEPVYIPPREYLLLVAGQLEDNRLILNRFSSTLLGATPALIVLSGLCGYFLSRRALNPVAELTASARSITIGNLQRRLPLSHTGDELERLAETCNDMLARLEGAVNRITRFTADASHELRSPITYITTLSELALRNPRIDDESADAFREIVRESQEAATLLEDMLTLAREDAGQGAFDLIPVDLHYILRDTYRRALPIADAKQQRISMSSDGRNAVRILGNDPSLRRLLWILVDNAIRYTPAGGQIGLSLYLAGPDVVIRVSDSGIGIPQSALQHIFERFFRVEGHRDRQEGTGLGLAIAKWISDVHQAKLSVESKEGQGTLFELRFKSA